MTDFLPFAESLARSAGEVLRQGIGRAEQVRSKSAAIDLVTEYDHKSEEVILRAIRESFPGHAILAEESGASPGDEYCWLVDPLDGTTNFAHAIPFFSVSIALLHHGRLLTGVVNDPMRDELFSAQAGQGASLNGRSIEVSDTAELDISLLVTGFPYDIWTAQENNLDHFAAFSLRTQGVRRLGSAALDLAYVAAGRLDGFWELKLNPWDVAAGALLVQEAGGRVTNVHGGLDFLSDTSILAANPALHHLMLQILQG